MKTLTFLIFMLAGMQLMAQEQSPIPKISQQITDYFNFYQQEKVFVTLDKTHYKPGETIWFSAFVADANNQVVADENGQLFVKLFDNKGNAVVQEIFKKNGNPIPGDILIPEDISADQYYLVAYTSLQHNPEEIFSTPIKIDPEYSNQWVAETAFKDSLSISGQKNDIYIILREISGDVNKNTQLRYEIQNGNDVIEKGKLKTDESGKATISFIIPAKTNGEPFMCVLSDNKNEWQHEIFLPTNIDPLIIKFYPEGGNIIPGTPTKIGFTAFNKWGLPVDVEGSLVDQEGKTISLVKSFTKGLGLFPVNIDETKKIKLVLSEKTGMGQTYVIPSPDPNGLSLSVVKSDADFISANLIFADKQKHKFSLMITQGSKMFWAADMEIDGLGRIKIPTDNLPKGINLLSVFSNTGTLLAERIVYKDEQKELKLEISPSQKNLQSNEQLKVKISLTGENSQPLSGIMAISVTDLMRKEYNDKQIKEYITVDSELETPFSLISGVIKDRLGNSALLDVYLISNRIKGFHWDKIRQFNAGNTSESNSANKGISGEVTDKGGNKVIKAKVSLVNNKNMQLLSTTTNDEGIFSFPNLNKSNWDDFSAKATDQDGKRELNIVLRKDMEGQISDYIQQLAVKCRLGEIDRVADANYFENNSFLFSKPTKQNKPNTSALDNQRKMLSSTTNLLDVIKTIKPFKLMNNQIVFFGSENSLNYQSGALLVLDGQQLGTDVSSIQNISTTEIDHINVSTNPMDIQRYTGLNSVGVVEIFLKNGTSRTQEATVENKNKYNGIYRIPNTFSTDPVNSKRDIRTTLLWIPDQKINETGEFEFTLTAGKIVSDFIIDVQGISDNGDMVSGKATFSVVKE